MANSKRKLDALEVNTDAKQTKKSKSQANTATTATTTASSSASTEGGSWPGSIKPSPIPRAQQKTPPLGRRTSGTPVQGIELQIPSRPATPITTKDALLASRVLHTRSATASPGQPAYSNANLTPKNTESTSDAKAEAEADAETTHTIKPAEMAVDLEAEWAAFEANVVNAPPASAENTSAPADSSTEKKVPVADAEIKDELEDASRAREEEFEEMEELETRVKKLRERREALRQKAEKRGPEAAPDSKEDTLKKDPTDAEDNDSGDDDDDDEADDWDGFRFMI